jgi:tetratricopeptide (TPR) repeat protein/predicted membrane-bound spermidine synthase
MVVPSATVFFAGACIVILELVASRLVARDLGSSLYTWTAIVGVVLAGVALGGYLGGCIVDRCHPRRTLAVLFGLASGACVAVIVLNRLVGDWMWLWRLSWPAHVFIQVSLVFLLPSSLLGAIAPVVAKMALDKGMRTGRTIGDIYAWGAAGSIVGIFLAGFVLIPTFGSIAIIWFIGAAMLVMAVLYWISCWAMYLWAMVFAALATMGLAPADWAGGAGVAALLREPVDPNVLYEDETPYCSVVVRQTFRWPDRRVFVQDKFERGQITMEDVTNLRRFHTRIWAGLTQGLLTAKPNPRMMVIGAGGYVFPQYLHARWPGGSVEVVEIDPGVTRAAMEAFGLERDSAIQTVHVDARNYMGHLLRRRDGGEMPLCYDFIYGDAFNGSSVPFHLVTKESNDKVSRLLADDGVYVMNLIDTYEGGRFLGAVVGTLEETFAHVYVVTSRAGSPSRLDTFVVIAARRAIDVAGVLRGYSRHLMFRLLDGGDIGTLREKAGGLILTDDYAPVESLLAPAVRQRAGAMLARKVLDKARTLQEQGCSELHEARSFLEAGQRDRSAASRRRALEYYARSIEQYERASQLDPSLSIAARNEIGMMRTAQGKPEEAVRAFRDAIEYHRTADMHDAAIGSVYMNLGTLLRRMGRVEEANAQLAEAARWLRTDLDENPRSAFAWDRLGNVLVTLEDMKGASDAFARAVELEPENPCYYDRLAKALERQQRYGEAIEAVRKELQLLQKHDARGMASQCRQYIELLEYERAKQPQ